MTLKITPKQEAQIKWLLPIIIAVSISLNVLQCSRTPKDYDSTLERLKQLGKREQTQLQLIDTLNSRYLQQQQQLEYVLTERDSILNRNLQMRIDYERALEDITNSTAVDNAYWFQDRYSTD